MEIQSIKSDDPSSSSVSPVAEVEPEQAKSSTTSIEDLYKYFGILADAKEQAGEHVDTYLSLIDGTRAGPKQKQLSAQFICRFFKYFPKQMPVAIDAIFDLCEGEDVNIRKAAIKDLSLISKDCPVELLNRIADILTQLLQTDDQQESMQVQSSLLAVLRLNPKSTLGEVFNQINTAELEQVRKRAIKFLCEKLPLLLSSTSEAGSASLFNKELEDLILKYVKAAFADVDAEEFVLFVRLLSSLPTVNRQDLIDIIMDQSELDKPFDPIDLERVMILMSCIQQALPFFSKNMPSTKYVNSYIENVLSIFNEISDESLKFEILKAFADLCSHYSSSLEPQQVIGASLLSIVYNLLVEYLPNPQQQHQQDENEKEAEEEEEEEEEQAKFNFSYVECLLYAFHVLAKFDQSFFFFENKERLKDFRLRLQYFAKGTQNYIKELRNTLIDSYSKSLVQANQNEEENKIRRVALKVTTNIDTLIKDFFHNPPSFKSSISLSWKSNNLVESLNQKQEQVNEKKANKRSLSVSSVTQVEVNQNGSNKKRPERGIYQPPSGKYSSTANATELSQTNTNNTNNNNNSKRRTFSSDNYQQKQRGANSLYRNTNSRF